MGYHVCLIFYFILDEVSKTRVFGADHSTFL